MDTNKSNEQLRLNTIEAIEGRIAEIEKEEKASSEREYRYGYSPDRMYFAKLFREKTELKQVIDIVSKYDLTDIQKELDKRDPIEKPGRRGLSRFSFEVLAHAETVLQFQDKELTERVDFGETVIARWEKLFGSISLEESQGVYALIRNKDIPMSVLEEKIRCSLLEGRSDLQKLVCSIGEHMCFQIDEWSNWGNSYTLGNDINDGEFYYAIVNGNFTGVIGYDSRPDRDKVEDDFMDMQAEIDINQHEAAINEAYRFVGLRDSKLVSQDGIVINENLNGAEAQEVKTMNDKEILTKFGLVGGDETFPYQMLSRMKADCEYYLGYGNRHPKYLWAGNEKDQIACMKALWNSFPEDKKPEWLTFNEIVEYERDMVGIEVLFTFGTSEQFPYQLGYVSITAPSVKLAIEEFRRHYPDHNEGILNCADYYYTAESVARIKEHGNGEGCHRSIVVSSRDKVVDDLIAYGKNHAINNGGNQRERELEH